MRGAAFCVLLYVKEPRDVVRVGRVSRDWLAASRDESLWQRFCERSMVEKPLVKGSWLATFRQCVWPSGRREMRATIATQLFWLSQAPTLVSREEVQWLELVAERIKGTVASAQHHLDGNLLAARSLIVDLKKRGPIDCGEFVETRVTFMLKALDGTMFRVVNQWRREPNYSPALELMVVDSDDFPLGQRNLIRRQISEFPQFNRAVTERLRDRVAPDASLFDFVVFLITAGVPDAPETLDLWSLLEDLDESEDGANSRRLAERIRNNARRI